MNLTAKEFSNQPEQAYREADRGNDVVINHDRYKDRVFILSSRERGEVMRELGEEAQTS